MNTDIKPVGSYSEALNAQGWRTARQEHFLIFIYLYHNRPQFSPGTHELLNAPATLCTYTLMHEPSAPVTPKMHMLHVP